MNVSEVHAMHIDVGCYVVDALEPAEREAFEAHLEGCGSCAQEVLEFTETAAELARLVAMEPPHRMRGATLADIHTVRPLPPMLEQQTESTLEPTPTGITTGAEPVVRQTEPGSGQHGNDQLADRRLRRAARRNRVLVALVAAAAVVALALGGLVVNLTRQHQANVAASAVAQRKTELLSAPDARVLTQTNGDSRYTFVVSKARNEALLLTSDLPSPGPGKTFQLWTLQGRRATPDTTMAAGADSQWFTGPVRDSSSLAVTVEPVGGSRQPTMPILAQVVI